MDRNLAERLVAELERHPPLTPNAFPDRAYFIDLLASTDVLPSERFYEPVKSNCKEIKDTATDQIYFLSIRGMLSNSLAEKYRLSKIKKFYDALTRRSIVQDSDADVWIRELRSNGGMVRRMAQCIYSHTLLAELERVDRFSEETTTMPLVVIPNIRDLSEILKWEISNQIDKEVLVDTIGMRRRGHLRY